jgi:hypothetical protein
LKGAQDCDITLKSLISEAGEDILNYLAGVGRVKAWLNVELPRVRNPRVDLLARLESGALIHVELQSTNEMTPQRMLEYGVGIWRQEGAFPRQLLLYVGNDPVRITNHIQTGALDYQFQLVDIPDLDGDAMLDSDSLSVNILSILAGSRDRTRAIRRIMMKIASLEPAERAEVLQKLLVLAGVRRLAVQVKEESRITPVTFDIMDNEVLGPAIRKGRQEGETRILRILLEQRFGQLSDAVERRLAACSVQEVEALALRLLDTRSIDELFSSD